MYVMKVGEKLSLGDYWNDPRFERKRPNLAGSRMLQFGDNIYRPTGDGSWDQIPSHHTYSDGSVNSLNYEKDTGADAVLISTDFVYWGGEGPEVPEPLRNLGDGEDIVCPGQNHLSNFSRDMVLAFSDWFHGLEPRGFRGRPGHWPEQLSLPFDS